MLEINNNKRKGYSEKRKFTINYVAKMIFMNSLKFYNKKCEMSNRKNDCPSHRRVFIFSKANDYFL